MKGKFKVKEDQKGLMPAHAPLPESVNINPKYDDVDRLMVILETDIEKLAELIPEELELLSNKLIFVALYNGSCDFLGGRAYSIFCVCAQVSCEDENGNTVSGAYSLAMWESDMEPCILGREAFGVPKTFADIDRVIVQGDDYYCSASHYNTTYIKMHAHLTNVTSEEDLAKLNHGKYEWGINLRHLPKPNYCGTDFEDIVAYPSINHDYMQLTGTGEIEWNVPEQFENPMQRQIIKAIADLPISDSGYAAFTKRSCQIISDDAYRLKKIF